MRETRPTPRARVIGLIVCLLIVASASTAVHLRQQRQLAAKIAEYEKISEMYAAAEVHLQEAAEKLALADARLEELKAKDLAINSLLNSRHTILAALDRDGRVLIWNEAAERYSGRSAAEMLGQTLERVMTKEGWKKHDPSFRALMRNPSAVGLVKRVPCEFVHDDPARAHNMFVFRAQPVGKFDPELGAFPMAIALGDLESKIDDLRLLDSDAVDAVEAAQEPEAP